MSKRVIKRTVCGSMDRCPFLESSMEVLKNIYEAMEPVIDTNCNVLLLFPGEGPVMVDIEDRCKPFGESSFEVGEVEDEYDLCMEYDGNCVVTLGGVRYLVESPLMILDIDEDGNERSVSHEIIRKALSFLAERETFIEVDDEVYQAFRLDE